MSFQVLHHCPQCGAPVFLDEADRFFQCGYCRVKSCISQKGFPRYYLSPHKDLSPDIPLFYLPYWRFKGIEYTCTPEGVGHRFLDISWLALGNAPSPVPYSLGFRPQALTLKRVSSRTSGTFIRPAGFKESFPRSRRSNETKALGSFIENIGETVSLIFAPFFQTENRIWDGVLNCPLGEGEAISGRDGCRPEKETQILSGLCPACGWDLEGQADSLALVCRNCQTLWQPQSGRLKQVRYGSCEPLNASQALIPFWKIDAGIRGLDLATASDLKELANLPDPGSSDGTPLSFWAPAFKIRPNVFLRLSRQLTLAQPSPALEKKIRPHSHLPVTLPASEAVQSIRITLFSMARPLTDRFSDIANAGVAASRATLIYLPFEPETHEFLNAELGLTINRNILHLSGNL